MTGFLWHQAISILWHALHLDPLPSEGKIGRNARKMNVALQGTGFTAKQAKVNAAHLTIAPSVKGLLMESHDGSWLPILIQDEKAFVLDANGVPTRTVKTEDAILHHHLWLFHKTQAARTRLFDFLRRHKGRLIEIFLCGFLVNLFGLTLPIFSSFVYDKILGNGITETLWALAISLTLIAVVEFSVRTLRVITAEHFAVSSETDIDHNVFQNLLHAKTGNLPSIGGFLDRYKQLLGSRDFLSSHYLLALADVPFLFLFLGAIVYAAGPLVFVPLTFGILMMGANALTTLPVFDYEREARKSSEKKFRLLTDFLGAHEAVIGEALRESFAQRWRASSGATTTLQSRARFWRTLGSSLSNSFSFLSYVGVLVGGVYMIEDRSLTSGGLLAASMLSSRALSSFASVVSLIIRHHEFKIALRDLDEIIPHQKELPTNLSRGRLEGHLFFENISFTHKSTASGQTPQAAIFKNLSLRFRPHEIVGIAGIPGAGKTTLLRLAANILAPDQGQVLIDHIPVQNLSDADITQNIGYKPQDLCLMEGTIEDAVRAGRPPLSAEDKSRLLHMSGLELAFQHTGLNWTTELGPRGTYLSGGQRQLVALARALYGQPALLLLDEPTNGLDTEMEAYLAKQITQLRAHSTILISTHSRALLSMCDRIIVVGKGTLLADGPREKVLVNG